MSTYYATGTLHKSFLSFTTRPQGMYFCHSHITERGIEAGCCGLGNFSTVI